jgi:enoyl-CoA hydratase/carnithine racemase
LDYQTVIFDLKNAVATITLNRPERMNAFDFEMCKEFRQIWQQLRDDDSVRVVVLRAAEGRAFCTGADVVKKDWPAATLLWDQDSPYDWISPKRNGVWKPLLCAMHGLVAGAAFFWLGEADIAICSDDALFFDPHVTYDMVAALEPLILRGRVGLGEILRISLMGNDERVCAQTALRIGLVSEVTKRSELWPRSEEIAGILAAKSPLVIQGTIRAIWQSLDMPRSVALENGLKYALLGNVRGWAGIDRKGAPRAQWRVR